MKRVHIFSLLCLSFGLQNCKSSKAGGAIPVFVDQYVSTTAERFFELSSEMKGEVIHFNKLPSCAEETIPFSTTSIIRTEKGDTLTVYSPCDQENLESGIAVVLEKLVLEADAIGLKREIYRPFPKSSPHYGFWECISCRFPNTIGRLRLKK